MLIFSGKNRVTSVYGNRTMNGSTSFHGGIDIVGEDSKDVRSVCDGTVYQVQKWDGYTRSGNSMQTYGNLIIIQDKEGYFYYYAHLAKIAVKEGQAVAQGKVIGVMGSTGASTGPHTHFERRAPDKTRVDPAAYLGIANAQGVYTEVEDGWVKVAGGQWKYRKKGSFVRSQWIKEEGFSYYIGADGIMVTGLQTISGKQYFFNPARKDNIPTGACIITDSKGVVKKVK